MLQHDLEEHTLQSRLRVLLPDTYQVFDDKVQPVSMGSAGLKVDADGNVLWNEMWASFCDLAMAGGPPHRGTLLLPSPADPQTPLAVEVSAEICRGISLVTGLCAEPSPVQGWVRMYCTSAVMAGWLMRAIVMENVSASSSGLSLDLPTGPEFRLHKEVKNVITAVAKTCHYWQDHMSETKHDAIASLLARMDREAPCLRPGPPSADRNTLADSMTHDLQTATGLAVSSPADTGWLGVDCSTVAAAVWVMRALVVDNLLSRREGTVVFVPINPPADPGGRRGVQAAIHACRLAAAHHVLGTDVLRGTLGI